MTKRCVCVCMHGDDKEWRPVRSSDKMQPSAQISSFDPYALDAAFSGEAYVRVPARDTTPSSAVMCMCVCVCVCVRERERERRARVCSGDTRAYVHTRTYVQTYTSTHAFVHTCTSTHAYLHTCTNTHAYLHT